MAEKRKRITLTTDPQEEPASSAKEKTQEPARPVEVPLAVPVPKKSAAERYISLFPGRFFSFFGLLVACVGVVYPPFFEATVAGVFMMLLTIFCMRWRCMTCGEKSFRRPSACPACGAQLVQHHGRPTVALLVLIILVGAAYATAKEVGWPRYGDHMHAALGTQVEPVMKSVRSLYAPAPSHRKAPAGATERRLAEPEPSSFAPVKAGTEPRAGQTAEAGSDPAFNIPEPAQRRPESVQPEPEKESLAALPEPKEFVQETPQPEFFNVAAIGRQDAAETELQFFRLLEAINDYRRKNSLSPFSGEELIARLKQRRASYTITHAQKDWTLVYDPAAF